MIRLRHLRRDQRGASLLYITRRVHGVLRRNRAGDRRGYADDRSRSGADRCGCGRPVRGRRSGARRLRRSLRHGAGRAERHEHGAGECRAQRDRLGRAGRRHVSRRAELARPIACGWTCSGLPSATTRSRRSSCRCSVCPRPIFPPGQPHRPHGPMRSRVSDRSRFPIDGRRTTSTLERQRVRSLRQLRQRNSQRGRIHPRGQTATTCSARTKGRSSFFAPAQVTTLNRRSTNLGTCQGTSKV